MLIQKRSYNCYNCLNFLRLCIHLNRKIRSLPNTLGSEPILRIWSTFYLTLDNEVIHRIIPVSDKSMIDRHGYRISDRRWILGEMSKNCLPRTGSYEHPVSETKTRKRGKKDIPIDLVSLREKEEKCILPRGRGKEFRFPRASKTLTGYIHAHIRPDKRGLKGSVVGYY